MFYPLMFPIDSLSISSGISVVVMKMCTPKNLFYKKDEFCIWGEWRMIKVDQF